MASPSSPISEVVFSELLLSLNDLKRGFPNDNAAETAEEIERKTHAGHCIRQVLLDASSVGQTRDHFRLHHGFQALVIALENLVLLSDRYDRDTDHQRPLLDYIQVVLGVLSAALQDHKGNQRFFRKRIGGGGWHSLKQILTRLLVPENRLPKAQNRALTERLFGCLLACSLNDELVVSLFSKLGKLEKQGQDGVPSKEPTGTWGAASPSEIEVPKPFDETDGRLNLERLLNNNIDSFTSLNNPDALSVMFELWLALDSQSRGKEGLELGPSQAVPSVIRHLASLSTHNLQALHSTPLLSKTLSCLLSSSSRHTDLTEVRSLAVLLLQLGVTNLDDAYYLYRQAMSSSMIADILLAALSTSCSPPYVHFDLSIHGYSSLELPSIGRVFPPTSPSGGYTFSLWLYVVQFDENSHTTLFGAFDSSQTCFMLLYLEKDTRNLILQTSVTSSRPSVRFKSTAFKQERWYHVAIVHRRPTTTMSSRASLYVDGAFTEQVKSNYPAPPSLMAQNSGGQNGSRRSNPIQAFLGTPQDLASRIGKGLIFSQWRFASAYLFGEALSDDLIAVYHQLGPKYSGNYQDRLGSFQTYQASAALNLRNESLHPGREDKSDIVTAVRQFASALLPESEVLLNISPTVVLDDDESNNINEKQLLKGLGRQASKNLRNVSRGKYALAINGAIPAINEALQHSSGFAIFTGDPVVVVPQSMDDAAWRVGGCAAVGLSLVESAQSHIGIITAIEILLQSIKDSWRNSEAMERENGFGVLAALLAKKLDTGTVQTVGGKAAQDSSTDIQEQHQNLSLEVLSAILRFVGYESEKPRESVINNPLAYRILLVDPDIWRKSYPAVQRLYYKQFVVFGADSKYHIFNSKRLSKMRKYCLHFRSLYG